MANIIDSMFGPTPYDVGQQRNTQDMSYAEKVARMGGFEQAKFGIGQGAAGLTRAGAGMMGMVDPLQQEAAMREGVMAQGGDLTTSAGLKAKAMQFAQAGDQRTAMKLAIAAKEAEAREQAMMIAERKQTQAEEAAVFRQKEEFALKKSEAEARIQQNQERINDARTSAAERAALSRENNQIKLLLGQAMIAAKQGGNGLGKPPSGYRYTTDGNLEAIPGGPADLKATAAAEQKAIGAQGLDGTLATLRSAYDRLEKGGGITSTQASTRKNIGAATSSSGIGQFVGKVVGSENQSARNDIAMTRPALLASLMKATGMSAKQIDSNAELKLWLTTATDPTLDVESNRRALASIEDRYLSKGDNRASPAKAEEWERGPDGKLRRKQ